MVSTITTFLLGALFAGSISYILHRMIIKAKVPDMINAEKERQIKDLEFDKCYLTKKLNLKTIQYNLLVKNVNEALLDDRKAFQDIIKQIDGK